MKKQIVLLFTLIFCLSFLNGCSLAAAAKTYDLPDAQQIVISDSATGEVLATLTGEQEIKAFCDALDNENNWKIRDKEDVPVVSDRECTFAMCQRETVKAGMKLEDAETVCVCNMYTYRDSDCLTMEFPFASFSFTLSAPAAAYLHGFAK